MFGAVHVYTILLQLYSYNYTWFILGTSLGIFLTFDIFPKREKLFLWAALKDQYISTEGSIYIHHSINTKVNIQSKQENMFKVSIKTTISDMIDQHFYYWLWTSVCSMSLNPTWQNTCYPKSK